MLAPTVLVDSLVLDVIDGLRESLHPEFGIRAFRLYRVIRTWAGKVVGEGAITAEAAAELRPQPRVEVWNGLRWVQMTCGLNEAGEIRLTEISLTYTEAQLTAQPLARNQEVLYALGEGHGQGLTTQLYGFAQPPFPDREKYMGWTMFLRKVDSKPWAP